MIDEHFYIDDDPRKAFSRDAWKLLQVLIQGQTGEDRTDSDDHLSLCQTTHCFQVIVQLQVLNELTRSLCDWGPSNSSQVRSSALKKNMFSLYTLFLSIKKMNYGFFMQRTKVLKAEILLNCKRAFSKICMYLY